MTYTGAVTKAFHPKNGWNYIKNHNEVGYWEEDNILFIVPKGSDGIGWENGWLTDDWSSNLKFPKKKYGKYRTHRGFDEDYKEIQEDIMAICLTGHGQGLKVVFIGFSRGGGMCYRMIEDWFYRTGLVAEAYLFGSPRIWGWKGCKRLKKIFSKTTNYQVCLVAHLPPVLSGS